MNTSTLDSLFRREMTRREFLIYSGMFIIGVFGITAFLKNIQNLTKAKQTTSSPSRSIGFGTGSYGGTFDGKGGSK